MFSHTKNLYDRNKVTFSYMRERLGFAFEKLRANYTGKLAGKPLTVGELVWLFTPKISKERGRKMSTYWTGPWEIARKISDVLFTVRTKGQWNQKLVEVVVSIDRIKRFTAAKRGVVVPYTNYQQSDFQLQDEFLERAEASVTGPLWAPPPYRPN